MIEPDGLICRTKSEPIGSHFDYSLADDADCLDEKRTINDMSRKTQQVQDARQVIPAPSTANLVDKSADSPVNCGVLPRND